jgi:hypothetical protein
VQSSSSELANTLVKAIGRENKNETDKAGDLVASAPTSAPTQKPKPKKSAPSAASSKAAAQSSPSNSNLLGATDSKRPLRDGAIRLAPSVPVFPVASSAVEIQNTDEGADNEEDELEKGVIGALRGAVADMRAKATHKYVSRRQGPTGKWIYEYHDSAQGARTGGGDLNTPHGVHPDFHSMVTHAGATFHGMRDGLPVYHAANPDAVARSATEFFATHSNPDFRAPLDSAHNQSLHHIGYVGDTAMGHTGRAAQVAVTQVDARTGERHTKGAYQHRAIIERPKGDAVLSDSYQPKSTGGGHHLPPALMHAVERRGGAKVFKTTNPKHIVVEHDNPDYAMRAARSELQDHGYGNRAIHDMNSAGHTLAVQHGSQQYKVTFVRPGQGPRPRSADAPHSLITKGGPVAKIGPVAKGGALASDRDGTTLEKGVPLANRTGLHFDPSHHRWMRSSVPTPTGPVLQARPGGWHATRDHLARQVAHAHGSMDLAVARHGKASPAHLAAKSQKLEAARSLGMHLLGTGMEQNKHGHPEYDAYASMRHNSTGGDERSGFKLTPQRQALHEKIIGHYMGKREKEAPGLHETADLREEGPHAIFMTGGSGSGKGYVKGKHFQSGEALHHNYVDIDPDEIKAHLAAADNLHGMHNFLPEHWHEESSHIAKQLTDRCHKEGRSYILDGVGGNAQKMKEKISAAHAAGHQPHALRVAIDRDSAWKQNLGRARSVGRGVFDGAHDGAEGAWDSIAEHVRAHGGRARVWDNSRQGPTAGTFTDGTGSADSFQKSLEKGAHRGAKHAHTRLIARRPHGMNPSHNTMPTGARKARIHCGKNCTMEGHVHEGHFHVRDVISGGASEAKILGHAPKYRPIPLARTKSPNLRLEYLA